MERTVPPQFNLTVFNHIAQITANNKFCIDLLNLIAGDEEFSHEFADFTDDLSYILSGNEIVAHEQNEYQICKYQGLRNFFFAPDFAKVMAEFILEKAGMICDKDKSLNVNLFVALGRKLLKASENNFEALEAAPRRNKGPVREIIVRRVVR